MNKAEETIKLNEKIQSLLFKRLVSNGERKSLERIKNGILNGEDFYANLDFGKLELEFDEDGLIIFYIYKEYPKEKFLFEFYNEMERE